MWDHIHDGGLVGEAEELPEENLRESVLEEVLGGLRGYRESCQATDQKIHQHDAQNRSKHALLRLQGYSSWGQLTIRVSTAWRNGSTLLPLSASLSKILASEFDPASLKKANSLPV